VVKSHSPAERRASVKACAQKLRLVLIFWSLFNQVKSDKKKPNKKVK
jgi:hypothetical protein